MDRHWEPNEVRRHLRGLCLPGHAALARPFDLVADRRRWSVASDGRMMLAVEALHYADSRLRPADRTAVKTWLKPPAAPTFELSLQLLRSWCGRAARWLNLVCSCGGKIGDGCSDCRGRGTLKKLADEPENVAIGGLVFDRTRLAKLIEPFRDKQALKVFVQAKDKPLVVDGVSWRAVLMPVNMDPEKKMPSLEAAIRGR